MVSCKKYNKLSQVLGIYMQNIKTHTFRFRDVSVGIGCWRKCLKERNLNLHLWLIWCILILYITWIYEKSQKYRFSGVLLYTFLQKCTQWNTKILKKLIRSSTHELESTPPKFETCGRKGRKSTSIRHTIITNWMSIDTHMYNMVVRISNQSYKNLIKSRHEFKCHVYK